MTNYFSYDMNHTSGVGLVSTLLFILLGTITDAPAWIKIIALIVGILAGITTILFGIFRELREREEFQARKKSRQ